MFQAFPPLPAISASARMRRSSCIVMFMPLPDSCDMMMVPLDRGYVCLAANDTFNPPVL
jgi:hypothetical protein